MSPDEFIQTYGEIVRTAAKREHKDSHLFTVEDLEQECWMALLPYVDRLAAESTGFIYRAAQNAASRYAESERQDHMYFRGCYVYTPDAVRLQLEVGAWESTPEGDWDMRLDVRDAYDQLNAAEQEALFCRFYLGEPSGTSARRNLIARGVDKMTNYLNGNAAVESMDLELAGETF